MNRTLRRTREYLGNRYHLIRDCVQAQKPFAIYNFTNSDQYNEFLNDLDSFGRLNYAVQTITLMSLAERKVRFVFPSIFVTNVETDVNLDEFKEIVKGSLSHYKLDSIVCLYDGNVSIFYRNGDHHPIGNNIYGSQQINEFQNDYYQVESTYYTFLT